MPPELKAVADRLRMAAACRQANGTLAEAVGIILLRLADGLAAGLEIPETALATALDAEQAAMSVRHVPPKDPRDVKQGRHPSFL